MEHWPVSVAYSVSGRALREPTSKEKVGSNRKMTTKVILRSPGTSAHLCLFAHANTDKGKSVVQILHFAKNLTSSFTRSLCSKRGSCEDVRSLSVRMEKQNGSSYWGCRRRRMLPEVIWIAAASLPYQNTRVSLPKRVSSMF